MQNEYSILIKQLGKAWISVEWNIEIDCIFFKSRAPYQFSSIIILLSNITNTALSKSLFVSPFASFLKGLTLLQLDFGVTFTGHLSGFSVGHTKDIISLNTSVDATVSWNWLSQCLDTFILWSHVYSVESCCCSIKVFLIFGLFSGLG